MRLDRLLSELGYGSRSEVKQYLKKRHVQINGSIITEGKFHVDPEQDEIIIEGELQHYQPYVYYLLNKPKGVITATEDAQHQTVLSCIHPKDRIRNLAPVGRLDKDTTGCLLLTNHGQLAHRLLSPKWHVPKVYLARTDGIITASDQQRFMEGIILKDGEVCQPSPLEIIETHVMTQESYVQITLYEGKYHQVKRMIAAVGKHVLALHRLSMGPLILPDELHFGEYIPVPEKIVKALLTITDLDE